MSLKTTPEKLMKSSSSPKNSEKNIGSDQKTTDSSSPLSFSPTASSSKENLSPRHMSPERIKSLSSSSLINFSSLEKLRNKKIYSIEGNIGAGKTTILSLLCKDAKEIEVVKEPIQKWQNLGGENLLDKFYSDPERWTFSFESYSMLSKIQSLIEAAESDKEIILLERSLYSNKIFMDISNDLGKMDKMEYILLTRIHQFYINHVYPILNGVIYLRTTVDECVNRINKRNRSEENTIDVDYLKRIEEKYDNLKNMFNIPMIVIDGKYDINNDFDKVLEKLNKFIEENGKKREEKSNEKEA